MYKVKRFSADSYYSDERQYNVVSDIYHSGLGRTWKKNIGRVRRNIGNKLGAKIDESRSKAMDAFLDFESKSSRELSKEQLLRNIDLNKKLVRSSRNETNGAIKFTSNNPNFFMDSPYNMTTFGRKMGKYKKTRKLRDESLSKQLGVDVNNEDFMHTLRSVNPERYKFIDNSMKNDHLVVLPKGLKEHPAAVGHEIGHAMNFRSYNPIKSGNAFLSGMSDVRKIQAGIKDPSESKGILAGLKNYIGHKGVVAEEANASKYSLKKLKELGMSKEELKESKDLLDTALNTYKEGGKVAYLEPLRRSIQIPSRI